MITVVYDRGDVGRAYPDEIRYTLRRVGIGLQSLDGDSNRDRVVSFEFEPRPDAPVTYAAGFEQRLDRRLDRIDVRIGTQLVRRYDLGYAVSPDSFRSLLAEVALYGSDADSGNPTPPLITSFTYHSNVGAGTTGFQEVAWPWPSNLPIVQGGQNEDDGVRLGDVDGDGLVDLIKSYAIADLSPLSAVLTSDSGVYLNTGTGFSSSKSSVWVIPQYTGDESYLTPFFAQTIDGDVWGSGRLPIDVTGDGRVDLVGGDLILHPDYGDFRFVFEGQLYPSRLFDWPWQQSSPSGWTESPFEYGYEGSGDYFISLIDWDFTTAYVGLEPGGNGYMTIGGNTRFADLTGDGLPEMIVRGTATSYEFSGTTFSCHYGVGLSYVIYNKGDLVFRHAPLAAGEMSIPPPVAGVGVPACDGYVIHSPADFAPCNPDTDGPSCFQSLFHNHAYGVLSNPPNAFYWDSHLELGNTPIDLNADGLADQVTA